jgi:2-polyprenyl-3-methyl-5-hydroxy-6-metoxy-1,4-benzoquinol methylase
MTSYVYIGNELELFDHALNWKAYFGSHVIPFVKGDVLEVGAGIGGTTAVLASTVSPDSWLCLEPDASFCDTLRQRKASGRIPSFCGIKNGTVDDLPRDAMYDLILYIDVVEHIEDDAADLERACRHLKPGGALAIIVPAFQGLYSPFDRAVGHYRRYSKKRLTEAVPSHFRQYMLRYLDSMGFFASVANRYVLRQHIPRQEQILFWDRRLIPMSRVTDRLLGYSIGKSLLGIWVKEK